jgi:LacI family transcriptional regulator
MNLANRPSAIFATNNLISLGALRALYEEKLKVPEDVSIISFDDQPYSAFLASPMTTVEQPIREIALIAFKLLLDSIESNKITVPYNILLPTKLIIRNSVKKIEINDRK